MTDSETIARLIYRAFVTPNSPMTNDMVLLPFPDVLELYAKARMRELIEAGKLELVPEPDEEPAPEPDCDGDSCPEAYYDDPPAPEPADTHTHTAGATEGEGAAPGSFAGKGSGEKRAIFEHLTAFVAARGAGARKKIADASNGALTVNELFEMSAAKPYPLAKWRVAEAAMNYLEQKEGNNAAEKV